MLDFRSGLRHHAYGNNARMHTVLPCRFLLVLRICAKLPAKIPAQFPPMAYIRAYRDGWRAEVQRNGQRLSKLFRLKRDAQAWALEQEASAKKLKQGWRTFGQAVQEYIERETIKKRAQQWEKNTLARLAAEFGESTPLGTIDQPRIAKWRDHRLKTVSGSTVLRESNLLKHLLRTARLEWRWIDHDPFEGVKMPTDNAPRHQVWRWHQIKRVLRANRTGKTLEVIHAFHIALHTAMRLSEVLVARVDGKVALLPKDKTTDGPVEVPLARKGVQLLKKYGPFTVGANEASVLFSDLCRDLLLDGLVFHDSRATALTLLSRRLDVLTLSRISRHRDLRTLRDHYYRETAREIAARL